MTDSAPIASSSQTVQAVITTPTARVYTRYDVQNPPPKPEAGSWTRFVCISDTHEREFPVPPGDVLLHGGDLTRLGRLDGAVSVARWLSGLSHPHKMCVVRSSGAGYAG